MKYKGIELTPITTPQIFDPPKEMLVWECSFTEPAVKHVYAITGNPYYPVVTTKSCYDYCAEIPEELKPKRATNLQLMEWLAKGNGMWKEKNGSPVSIRVYFFEDSLEKEVDDFVLIRPFGTTEWLEPTLENMGLE